MTRTAVLIHTGYMAAHRFGGNLGIPELPVALDASGDHGRDFDGLNPLAFQSFPSLVVGAYDLNLLLVGGGGAEQKVQAQGVGINICCRGYVRTGILFHLLAKPAVAGAGALFVSLP